MALGGETNQTAQGRNTLMCLCLNVLSGAVLLAAAWMGQWLVVMGAFLVFVTATVFYGVQASRAAKQKTAVLARENYLLESLLNSLPYMVFVKEAQELRFVRFNRAGAHLLGMPQEKLIGKNDRDFFPKEQADFFIEKDRLALASKEIIDIPEEIIHTADGVKRFLRTIKFPLRDEEGKPIYLVGVSEDITERKKSEKEKEEAEARFQRALSGTSDGLWEWNIPTNSVYYSPRCIELFGYTEKEFDQTFDNWSDRLCPEDRERVFLAIRQHLQDRIPYDIEYRAKSKEGSYRWYRSRGQATWDAEGNPLVMTGFLSDITASKKAIETLQFVEEQFSLAQTNAFVRSESKPADASLIAQGSEWAVDFARAYPRLIEDLRSSASHQNAPNIHRVCGEFIVRLSRAGAPELVKQVEALRGIGDDWKSVEKALLVFEKGCSDFLLTISSRLKAT